MKVLVHEKLSEEQIKELKAVSNAYEIVFEDDNKEAEILVGNFSPLEVKEYSNLKMMISTWAGVDAFIKKDVLNDNVILCSGANSHNEEVAEHMFVTLLMMEKKLHLYRNNQYANKWKDEGKVKSICDETVLILGLGKIGNELAKLLKSVGIKVIAIKRDISFKPAYVDELYTMDELDELLPRVDALLNILPSTNETHHMFTLEKFKLMKPDALLINAGRGDFIDTNVLIEVLDQRIIRGIGQDVFEKEPLPEDSPLWKYDNLVITPHVAGFFHLDKCRQKWVDMVKENLRRYINNEELINLIKEREE